MSGQAVRGRSARVLFRVVVCAACLAGASLAWGATPDDCQALRKHGRLADAQKCYESLTDSARSSHSARKASGALNNTKRRTTSFASRRSSLPRTPWFACAGAACSTSGSTTPRPTTSLARPCSAIRKARKPITASHSSARTGLITKRSNIRQKAIELDPKMYEAHELMASLLLEDNDQAKAFEEADAALKISPEALDAMAIHAAIEILDDRSPDAWLAKIHAINPVYGEGYALIARSAGLEPPLRRRDRLLPQGDRGGPAALVGARAARHQSDAPRPGG